MRPIRKVSKSLVNDIVAVAAHQTEEIQFLRAALQIIGAAAMSGLSTSGHPTFAYIKSLCDEARLNSEAVSGDGL